MKTTLIIVLLAAAAGFAADEPAGPQPMSADDKSAVLSNMLTVSLLEAQLNQSQLMQALRSAQAQHQKTLADMREKYGAGGCGVSVRGEWTGCPDEQKKEEEPAPVGTEKDEGEGEADAGGQ